MPRTSQGGSKVAFEGSIGTRDYAAGLILESKSELESSVPPSDARDEERVSDLLLLACYRPLWRTGCAGRLAAIPPDGWPEAVRDVMRVCLHEPLREQALKEEILARLNAVRSPFRTAEAFLVEELIDPRDTRRLVCEFANLAAPLRTPGRSAFHLRP